MHALAIEALGDVAGKRIAVLGQGDIGNREFRRWTLAGGAGIRSFVLADGGVVLFLGGTPEGRMLIGRLALATGAVTTWPFPDSMALPGEDFAWRIVQAPDGTVIVNVNGFAHPGQLVRLDLATGVFTSWVTPAAPVFPLVRDRGGGEVVVGRDGEPSARYRLSRYDLRHLRAGFLGAARILEAAGARRIVSAHASPVLWEPRDGAGAGRFLADPDARGWEPNRVMYASAHLMGTARMGGSPSSSACDPLGEAWEAAGLVVCDGAAFPSASGVNPMVSIAALAHMNATALAQRLA